MVNTKVLFLDLDGTIREPIEGEWVSIGNQKPIHGALERMQEYSDNGYTLIGVTNQGGVPKYKSLDDCILEQEETLKLFPLLQSIYLAPGDGNTCWHITTHSKEKEIKEDGMGIKGAFRKPATGMIRAALMKFPTNIEHILMVGDRQEDMICAENAGIEFIWNQHWLDPITELF